MPSAVIRSPITRAGCERSYLEERPGTFCSRLALASGSTIDRYGSINTTSGAGLDLLREAITRGLQRYRVHCWLQLPDSAGRLRARLFASGFVTGERAVEQGWELQIDAPRNLLEPLFGLPVGEGEWLRNEITGATAGSEVLNAGRPA